MSAPERSLRVVPTALPRWSFYDVIRDQGLPPNKKVVLLIVVSRFGKRGTCFAALETIVDDSGGLKKRAVQKYLTELVNEKRLIRRFDGRHMVYRAVPRLLGLEQS